jgi:hypothetical protein
MFAAGAEGGALVERTVAFINRKPVLLSDIALTRALLKLDEKESTERTIDEFLMYVEAARLSGETPPPEETVAAAVASLAEKAGPGFSAAALRRKALVQLAIANYIELRLRPQVRVEDDEVRRVYNERLARDPETTREFSLLAESIRETLESQALDLKIEEWVTSLRAREEVRRVPARPSVNP